MNHRVLKTPQYTTETTTRQGRPKIVF